MSDNTNSADVEDVLNSVRRLVSPRGEASRSGSGGEKLLLTPALRVAERPKSAADRTATRTRARSALEERIAELEAAVGAQPSEWEPDGSEEVDEETPDRFVFAHAAPAQALEPMPSFEAELDAADAPAEVAEDTVAEDPVADEPDGEEAPADVAAELPEEDVDRFVGPAPEALDAEASTADGAELPRPRLTLGSVRSLEPDEDLPETEAAEEPGDDAASIVSFPDRAEEDEDEDDEPELYLDEDTLRLLVADIIREELQGVLGERITRNVRKLVRREIHRALMTREFD